MLDDYFSIKIKRVEEATEENSTSSSSSGAEYYLEALPMLLEDVQPDLVDLPMFIIRLVSVVDWTDEKSCFESICKEIAFFYSIKNSTTTTTTASSSHRQQQQQQQQDEKKPKESWHIEHVLYRAFRNFLLPSKANAKHSRFKLVDLAALYRVFERC